MSAKGSVAKKNQLVFKSTSQVAKPPKVVSAEVVKTDQEQEELAE